MSDKLQNLKVKMSLRTTEGSAAIS